MVISFHDERCQEPIIHLCRFVANSSTEMYVSAKLLHCHTLGQIPWFIYIPVQEIGTVVGQKLTGDHCQDWIQKIEDWRKFYHLINHFSHLVITLSGNGYDRALTALDLVNITEHFFMHFILG